MHVMACSILCFSLFLLAKRKRSLSLKEIFDLELEERLWRAPLRSLSCFEEAWVTQRAFPLCEEAPLWRKERFWRKSSFYFSVELSNKNPKSHLFSACAIFYTGFFVWYFTQNHKQTTKNAPIHTPTTWRRYCCVCLNASSKTRSFGRGLSDK